MVAERQFPELALTASMCGEGGGVPVSLFSILIQVDTQVCCASQMLRGPALPAACWVCCFPEAGLPYDPLALWTLIAKPLPLLQNTLATI